MGGKKKKQGGQVQDVEVKRDERATSDLTAGPSVAIQAAVGSIIDDDVTRVGSSFAGSIVFAYEASIGISSSTLLQDRDITPRIIVRSEEDTSIEQVGFSAAAVAISDISGVSDNTIVEHDVSIEVVPVILRWNMDGKRAVSVTTKAYSGMDGITSDNTKLLLQLASIIQHIINLHDGDHKVGNGESEIAFSVNYNDFLETQEWYEMLCQPGERITPVQAYRWILSVQDLLLQIAREAFVHKPMMPNVSTTSLEGKFDAILKESYIGRCYDVGIRTDLTPSSVVIEFLLDNKYEVSVETRALVGGQITSDNKKLLLQIACIVQTVIDGARQIKGDHSIKVEDDEVKFAVNYADQSEYKSWVEACRKPDELENPDGWIISVQDLFLRLSRAATYNIEPQAGVVDTVLVGEFTVTSLEYYSSNIA